ncbi:MAG: hypothetical protein H2069_02655 [Legionella sp.]|nr:hypothetical protein [Legionella sp.]
MKKQTESFLTRVYTTLMTEEGYNLEKIQKTIDLLQNVDIPDLEEELNNALDDNNAAEMNSYLTMRQGIARVLFEIECTEKNLQHQEKIIPELKKKLATLFEDRRTVLKDLDRSLEKSPSLVKQNQFFNDMHKLLVSPIPSVVSSLSDIEDLTVLKEYQSFTSGNINSFFKDEKDNSFSDYQEKLSHAYTTFDNSEDRLATLKIVHSILDKKLSLNVLKKLERIFLGTQCSKGIDRERFTTFKSTVEEEFDKLTPN